MARIDQDHSRFKQIVRGRIKNNLKKYITRGELIGRKGKALISIPLPQIDLPHFVFEPKQKGGVGQGEGDVGSVIGTGEEEGSGQAGDSPGQHIMEVDVPLEELAQLLGEELQLPVIQNKGRKNIVTEKDRYSGVATSGPESLRHFKRTYREALKRQIASGTYSPMSPAIIPIRKDKRYRSWRVSRRPECNAAIIYMMDVSGSMGEEQKEIVRIESFWIDTWLRSQYQGLEVRYIVHDAEAREVDQETFYHTRESGGTVISSAYKLCDRMMMKYFPPDDWNIYLFHFSDGENFGDEDDRRCLKLLREDLLPPMNLFCYGQVESGYGRQFMDSLSDVRNEKLAAAKINDDGDVYSAIKTFLGKGV